jgi:phosphoribosylanthranilate isomerase
MMASTHESTYGRPRLKICCIGSEEEAAQAITRGASALGLVSAMPSGVGVISDERIAEIADVVPPGIATVLLTSKTDAAGIVEQQRRCRVNTLQLVDAVPPGTHEEVRTALPGIKIIQVIHVMGTEAIEAALKIAPAVDALLLDSGNPTLEIKELGGTGRVHDWSISRQIVEAVHRPVFLAGGLVASNVAQAYATVRPYGLDVCSGLRTKGRLDDEKLAAYCRAVDQAAGVISGPFH